MSCGAPREGEGDLEAEFGVRTIKWQALEGTADERSSLPSLRSEEGILTRAPLVVPAGSSTQSPGRPGFGASLSSVWVLGPEGSACL